ncbi:MAG: deoxyhypusine synthase family protein, partial [Candidatus Thermoplasmatota archaeon]|nr:deoxyhypusine synthase family protein [Candidatus Thermoplasmatota archaeon]
VSTERLCRVIGEHLAEQERGPASLLAACADEDVPVFVPGITDGSVGAQLWSWYETHRKFQVDLLADEHRLSQLVDEGERLGAIMVGGGISKHHLIWWAQFREGLDDAVYITTAPEHDGSLSGARMREAISWSKMKPEAGHVTVPGEATVLLPLILGAALAE